MKESKEIPDRRKIFASGSILDQQSLVALERDLRGQGLSVEMKNKTGLLGEKALTDSLKKAEVYVLGGDETVTGKVVDEAKKLKLILFLGDEWETFFTQEAIQKLKERGVRIENTPGMNTNAVAEMTAGLILTTARRIPEAASKLRQGMWDNRESFELQGKTLGIIGLGRIGVRVAHIMRDGFGMNVVYWSRTRKKNLEKEAELTYLSLKELLQESDIVTVHLQLNEETRNFLHSERLALMKKGAYLINPSRAALVDPTALRSALESGHLSGASFDGYYFEGAEFQKTKDPYGLVHLESFLVTPHQAFNTRESNERTREKAVEVIKDYFHYG